MPADVLIQRAAIFSSALLFAFSLSVLPAAAQDGQVSGAMLLAPKDLDLAAAGAFERHARGLCGQNSRGRDDGAASRS